MSTNKIIIAGGRNFNDYPLLKQRMDFFTQNMGDVEVVCGKAIGADTLGEQWAKENNHNIAYFPADWDNLGRGAGHIRNRQMAKYGTHLVLFWDGSSKGSASMLKYAQQHDLKVREVIYE